MKYLIVLGLLLCTLILSATAPVFDPGNPYVSGMSDIELQVFWPNSNTLRGDTWECLVRVVNQDYDFYTLSLHGNPIPGNDHVWLSALWAFGEDSWSVIDGSCFILYNDSVRYTRPIVNLPYAWTPITNTTFDNFVFLPQVIK